MMIKPPSLRNGATIGVVAPSSPFDPDRFRAGVSILEEMGFRVALGSHVMSRNGHLAGSDEDRLADFRDMLLNPEVDAIMAARGGYGALRIVGGIDFDAIRRRRVPVIGFSDVTVLLNAIAQRCSLVALHAPMVHSLPKVSPDSLDSLRSALTSETLPPLVWEQRVALRNGVASGPLYGGNLATLISLMGTPFEPSFDNAILMLEDVHEPLYRIDRMLTQLKLAGALDNVAGILLGEFSGVDKERVWERVLELAPPSVPVWGDLPFGHGAVNHTWPIGAVTSFGADDTVRFSVP